MILTDYFTYDEARSLLGVTAKELADAVIALPHWALGVEQEFRDLVGGADTIMTQYSTIHAIPAVDRTAAQTQFYNVTRMCAMYFLGWELVQRADTFSPLKITDGKAAVDRLDTRFDKVKPAIESGLERLKQRVKEALAILDPAATIVPTVDRTYILGVGLGTDPVTGA